MKGILEFAMQTPTFAFLNIDQKREAKIKLRRIIRIGGLLWKLTCANGALLPLLLTLLLLLLLLLL